MKKEKLNEENKIDEVEKTSNDVAKKEKPAKVTKVGAMLKEMRLQKGLKVVDVSKKLCIRKCYLEAIEDSNYEEVPAFPYGVGFIRSYANFLGLNGENIFELFKEETNASNNNDMHILEPQPEATMPGLQYLLISLLAIVAIYACWMFFNQNQSSTENADALIEISNTEQSADNGVIVVEEYDFASNEINPDTENTDDASQIVVSEDEYVAETKDVDESKNNDKSDTAKTITSQDEKPTSVETPKTEEKINQKTIPETGVFIEVLKETWIEVKDENKLYISKVLQAGNDYVVPAGKGKILSVGKYDGVNVYVNGKLTTVARPNKKTNIALDKFLEANN